MATLPAIVVARICSRSGKRAKTAVNTAGIIAPPQKPWTRRQAISPAKPSPAAQPAAARVRPARAAAGGRKKGGGGPFLFHDNGPMTTAQIVIFTILAAMLGLFLWDRLRYDLVALLALLAAVLGGVIPASKAFAGFSNEVVPLIAGALVVSAAIRKSGLI